MTHVNYQQKFYRRAQRAARLVSSVPFVKMVALNGSVASGKFNQDSDIDFLIITKSNRLYTARFFAAMILKTIGWYRTRRKVAGQICLNCFLSEAKLSIEPELPSNRNKVASSCESMIPLADKGEYFQKFFTQNKWITRKSGKKSINYNFPIYTPRNSFEFLLSGRFGKWFELAQKRAQSKRILAGKKPNDQIYLCDYFIKLHPEKVTTE
jgi:predicted nucleotidyltransferase